MKKKAKRWDEIIRRLPRNGLLIEVGVWKGALAQHVLTARPDARMILVDPWTAETVETALRPKKETDRGEYSQSEVDAIFEDVSAMAHGFGARCRIMRSSSVYAARLIEPRSVDMVFIDAIHTYEALSEDIREWLPAVRDGGIIGGHDFGHEKHPGVRAAVVEAFTESSVETGEDHCWFVQL